MTFIKLKGGSMVRADAVIAVTGETSCLADEKPYVLVFFAFGVGARTITLWCETLEECDALVNAIMADVTAANEY